LIIKYKDNKNKGYLPLFSIYFLLFLSRTQVSSTSFNQIYERGLYISPKILKEDRSSVDFSDFVDNYKIETSHLILGTPGVGKSFLSFLLQKRMIEKGHQVIVLPFQEIHELLSEDDSVLDATNKYLKNIILNATTKKTQNLIFIIDGLDEFNEWEKYENFFEKLTRYSSVIAFSREIEYNNIVSKFLTGNEFDSILKVKKWTYECEFMSFLELLLDSCHLNEDKYFQILNSAREFKDHLTTPLLSRMYIYVLDNHDQPEVLINNKALLYSLYIQKLANDNERVIDFWKNAALDALLIKEIIIQ
jgi:hypothetical protein